MACTDVAKVKAKATAMNLIILSSVVNLREAPELGGTGASRLSHGIGRLWGVWGGGTYPLLSTCWGLNRSSWVVDYCGAV